MTDWGGQNLSTHDSFLWLSFRRISTTKGQLSPDLRCFYRSPTPPSCFPVNFLMVAAWGGWGCGLKTRSHCCIKINCASATVGCFSSDAVWGYIWISSEWKLKEMSTEGKLSVKVLLPLFLICFLSFFKKSFFVAVTSNNSQRLLFPRALENISQGTVVAEL